MNSNDFWALVAKKKANRFLNSNTPVINTTPGFTVGQETPESKAFWERVDRNRKISPTEISTVKTKLSDDDDDDIAPVKEEDDSLLDFFQKGSFSDGFDWTDIPSSILGTAGDAGLELVKGVASLGEGIGDAISYGVSGLVDLAGNHEYAQGIRREAKKNLVDNATKGLDNYLEQYSVLGRTSDAILGGVGYYSGLAATGGIGSAAGLSKVGTSILTNSVMGTSAFGSGMSEAYNGEATDGEAVKYAAGAAASEVISEMLFGGMGKAVNALGFNRGLLQFDDMAAKAISKFVKSQTGKNIVEGVVKAGFEGLEEVVAGFSQAALKKMTYMSEKDFGEILEDENLFEQFVVGSFTSGISQSPSVIKSNKAGRDFVTGMTQNEQAVVDKEVEKRIAELEKDGKKLTGKQKADIQEKVEKDMEKGYISTDTIEEVLGGETWQRYKDTVDNENALKEKLKAVQEEFDTLNRMKQGEMTGEQIDRRNDLKLELQKMKETVESEKNHSIRDHLKQELGKQVSEMVRGDRLIESYNERSRRGQAYQADLKKYDAKQRAVIENAQKSGILNNTNRTHEFVDMVAKIAADKGVLFDFTNNAKLKESGFAVEGKVVNGYVTKDGITVNIQSPKALNSTVGHEITHVLEGTDLYTELQNSVIEYAKTKGEYQTRFDALTKLYENVEGADINAELTADLVGDYLFTDENFIQSLSVSHRNVFQKIYDEVKYLVKVATAGSKEARELERVKRLFEKAYQESTKVESDSDAGVKYSLNLNDLTIDDLLKMSDEDFDHVIIENGLDAYLELDDSILLDDDFSVEDISEETEVEPEIVKVIYRRSGLGDSHVAENRSAVMTQERIDQRIAEHGAMQSDYARRYITRISPKDFIDLTVYEQNMDRAAFDSRVRGDHDGKMGDWDYEKQLRDSKEPPVLIVNQATGQVIGHNGRHRVRALEMAGIESVEIEVELHDEDGYLIKYNAKTIPDMAISSQFDTAIETHISNIVPLNNAHRSEIASYYGEKAHANAGVKYSLYSRPDFNQKEWDIVNRRKHSEFTNPAFDLDTDRKWMYANEKGFAVFAIYSIHDAEDPTVLYGSRGEKADQDYAKLNRFFEEGQRYAGNNRATFDRILNDIKSGKRNAGNGISPAGGRGTATGNVFLPFGESESNGRRNYVDGAENLREDTLTEYNEEASEKSGASFVTFSNDYATIRNFMKEGDKSEETEVALSKHSLTDEEVQETNQKLSEANLQYDAKSGTVYSLSSLEDAFSYNKSEADYQAAREEYVNALMKATGKTSKEANSYLDSLFLVHDMIAADNERLNYDPAPNRTAWVSNAEYGGSIDFSTLCAKRRLFTGTFDAIQMALPDAVLNENDFLKIRDMLLKKGYESPCSMCYVEGSRAKHGVYVDKWLKEYLKTDPEWKPQIADFASTTRLEQTRIQHPEAYASYKKAMNALSQRKPKEASVRTDYKGEILRDFRNDSTVAEKNKNGGVRFNSFSDFEIIHALDAMQVITDMARVGLNGQAYTKVKEFAEAFGNTGLKINLSLVAKDVDANGRLVMDETNGMNYAEAMDIRNRYSENVGTVIVVFNDAQLKAALADSSIDYVLPFHRSQWKKSQYALMGLPEATRDYTNIQNERYKNPKTGRPKKVPEGNIMPNEYWDFRLSGRENAQKYLDYINENSYIPKFDFLLNRVDGKWTLPEGGVGDGYFKLLIDFKMYDNDGWGSPQRPVLPEFNMPYIQQMLKDYKGGHQAFPVAHDVVNEFVESKKYSLSEEGAEHPVYGNYNVYGSDVGLETTENSTPVQKTQLPAENSTVSKEERLELFPDEIAPDLELESLIQRKTDIESRMQEAFNEGDDKALESLGTEYGEVMEQLTALESEIAETEEGRLGSIQDTDAPPETEAPYYEDIAPVQPENPMADRNIEDVGNRKVNAYMYENPEVKPFFQAEARVMLGDLSESVKGEKLYNDQLYYESGGEKGWSGVRRQTTSEIADLLDNYGYTYAQIEKGLNAIVEDNGKENNAVSKRIEFALNDRLRNGYTNVWGEEMPPDQGYIKLLQEKQINEYSQEAFENFMANADQYAPEDIAPVFAPVKATAEESTADDIAPTFDVVGKKGVPDGQQAFLPDAGVEPKLTRKLLHQNIVDRVKNTFHVRGFEFDDVLKKAKDLSTFATVDNTPQRVMEKALGYKQGQILSDITVNKVAQNETEGIKWLNSFTDRKSGLLAQISKQYHINPGSKESAAAQMYAEGFYVGENDEIIAYGAKELAADFPDPKVRNNIVGLARDPRIRRIYDETLAAINESRKRNAYPEIPRLDNYFLHFRAMEDTFSRLGLPFNPNDIRAKDLPTDLNGVTADLKPGQPYFASAMHRTGKRTSFDLLGGLEKYLTSAKNQIYHIDDIQTLRALRNYIAEQYGQATGLENLSEMSDEEAAQRIEDVYGSHLSTFAKFLNEEANVLAGKTALIDRGLEGIIGRRGITFLDTLNRQVGSNMVGYNISSSLTNFIAPVQALAKSNKADFVKGFAQTAANKVGSIFGRGDSFAEESPVMIRRKGAERFYRTPWQKLSDPGYILMGAVDDISTELIARAKFNEFTRQGMDSQTAHIETDKWVSRLMGDRSLGQQPQLYNSKMLGIITKFQLEVRNQLDSQFYDTIQEAKASTEEIENALTRNAKKAAKITSTFVQLAVAQHLFGKAFESIAGYNPAFDIIEAIIKAFGWDDDEEDEDTVLDNIEQGFFELMGDMPYVSTMTGGRIPLESALPIKELYKGEDQYGNEKSRWETLTEAAPYWLLPGGAGQIKKTKQGLGMFDEDLPIAGSYTDSDKLRFPVEDTPLNRLQAALFGQYASENARDYFDNERKALGEKQIEEFMDSDLPIRDYWEYREGLSGLDKLSEKADYIDSLDLPIGTKNLFINNIADRKERIDMTGYSNYSSFEEFDFAKKNPEKYSFLKENGVSVDQYNSFDEDTKDVYSWAFNNPERYQFLRSQGVTLHAYKDFDKQTKEAYGWAYENPDSISLAKTVGGIVEYNKIAEGWKDLDAKDENGNTVSGLKKQRVYDYIYSLDIPEVEKHILFKSRYTSDDSHNYEIIDYLNSRSDISYEEMIEILKKLKFEVDEAGNIYW